MGALQSGQALLAGQSMQSEDHLNTFVLQNDGNLVLYNDSQHALWATNTAGKFTPGQLVMQTDGNLVLYDNAGAPRWASGTCGHPGAFFVVQSDGILVVYRAGAQAPTADNALWASASNDRGVATPGPSSDVAMHMLNLVNQQRAAANLPPLTLSSQLMASAQAHSQDMASRNFMDHAGSDGSTPFDRMQRAGYEFTFAAENIAAGEATPEHAMSDWMGEVPPNDGHRRNILSPDVRELGVGYAYNESSGFKHYWTQDFGSRG